MTLARSYTFRGGNHPYFQEFTLMFPERGCRVEPFRVRTLGDAEKRPVLKAYLDRFQSEVERYFPVPAAHIPMPSGALPAITRLSSSPCLSSSGPHPACRWSKVIFFIC
jgi:hypothetical protein